MSNFLDYFYVLLSITSARAVAPTEANGPEAFPPLLRIVEACSTKCSLPMKPHLRPLRGRSNPPLNPVIPHGKRRKKQRLCNVLGTEQWWYHV